MIWALREDIQQVASGANASVRQTWRRKWPTIVVPQRLKQPLFLLLPQMSEPGRFEAPKLILQSETGVRELASLVFYHRSA